MSVTVNDLITNHDAYISDTSTDRISQAERFQNLTEAVVWLQQSLGNDHMNATYELDFLDTVYYYKITAAVPDVLQAVDLRREEGKHLISFPRKSARELAEEIGQGFTETSYAIERRDSDWYLVINHGSDESATTISDFDSLTAGGGTWEVDASGSDATNLTVDSVEYKQGNSSLNFDIDVSQSGNDVATIRNTTMSSMDLSSWEDRSSFLFWIYVPDVTDFTSVTLYWGSDTSNYWSATATTDIHGNAFVAGWNQVKLDWSAATKTSSPDVTAIDYVQVDFNYAGTQGDDTDFRLDYLRMFNPEKLTFYYTSWYVGTNTGGTDITVFTATNDVPFFSGKYDQYRYPVAHKAASTSFRNMRMFAEAQREEQEAEAALDKIRDIIPSSTVSEIKSFKVHGVRFARRGARK